jgi:lambda repressor-like predicted transcriptional regulator
MSGDDWTPEQIRDRLRRRAAFLRELAEARELRRRVAPRRSRRAQIHATLRKRTFRAE